MTGNHILNNALIQDWNNTRIMMVISCNITIWSFLLNQQSFNAAIQSIIQSHGWRDCCQSQDTQSWQTWRLQDCWSKTKMFCEVKEVHCTYSHTCIIVWLQLSMFESLHVTLYIYIYTSILSNHIISYHIMLHVYIVYMYIIYLLYISYRSHVCTRRSSDGTSISVQFHCVMFFVTFLGPKGSERIRKESATRSGYPKQKWHGYGQDPGTQTVPYKLAD